MRGVDQKEREGGIGHLDAIGQHVVELHRLSGYAGGCDGGIVLTDVAKPDVAQKGNRPAVERAQCDMQRDAEHQRGKHGGAKSGNEPPRIGGAYRIPKFAERGVFKDDDKRNGNQRQHEQHAQQAQSLALFRRA